MSPTADLPQQSPIGAVRHLETSLSRGERVCRLPPAPGSPFASVVHAQQPGTWTLLDGGQTNRLGGGQLANAHQLVIPTESPVGVTSLKLGVMPAQMLRMASSVPLEPRGTLNERRWGEVLEVASEVFGERGYPAASLQEIAERLGISKGSLYYYARSKEDLLFEILKRTHDHALTVIREDDLTRQADPAQRLESFIRRWMDGLLRQQFTALNAGTGGSRHNWTDFLSDDRRSKIVARRQELNRYLLELVREGMARRDFNPQLDAQFVTNWIFIVMNGTRFWFRANSMSWADITDWYVTLVSSGLGRGSPETHSSFDRKPLGTSSI